MAFKLDFGAIQRGQEASSAQLLGIGRTIGEGIKNYQLKKQKEEEETKMVQARKEGLDALSANDPEAISQFMVKYPGMGEQLQKAYRFKNQEEKLESIEEVQDILTTYDAEGPEGTKNLLEGRINDIIENKGDPGYLVTAYNLLDGDPESFKKVGELTLAGLVGPEEYLSYSRERDPRSTLTTSEKDFERYQKLKMENPDAARQFGIKTGFIKPEDKKRLFKVKENTDGSYTKFYSDGSEEEAKPKENIKLPGMKSSLSPERSQKIMGKATEGSKRAASFALRLRDDIDQMKKLVDNKEVDPKRIALINKAFGDGTIANMSLNPAEQEYLANARDAMYAILRPETGAAITNQETLNYSKLYLPQPGDSDRARDAKIRKMENQWRALRGQSGNVYDAMNLTGGFSEIDKKEKTPEEPVERQPDPVLDDLLNRYPAR